MDLIPFSVTSLCLESYFIKITSRSKIKVSPRCGENENAIYTQLWCTLIAQLLLTVTQKISQTKKAFSVVASLVRIHLIRMLDVFELLRNTKRAYTTRGPGPPLLQLSLNLWGG